MHQDKKTQGCKYMNNYNMESTEKKPRLRKRLIKSIFIMTLISLLIFGSFRLFSVSASSEPSTETILKNLGFNNIALEDVETFSAGMYNITLLAEFSSYHSINELSYYAVETSNYNTIFTGPEGITSHSIGYVVPPLFRTVVVNNQFALSILSREHRYFTEHYLNLDFPKHHAKVYINLDDSDMFLIGFESCHRGRTERDYNDMIFSMRLISPQIVNVTRSFETPNYDQAITVTAQISKGDYDINSIVLSYQIDSGRWTNKTMRLESGVYVTDIPAQSYNTTVKYKVYASDTVGNTTASAVSAYTVNDFVSPVISNITQIPELSSKASIKVSATVNEPPNASGVKIVKLGYSSNAVWTALNMTIQNKTWTATISEQTKGTPIIFFVEAFDNVGNSAKTADIDIIALIPDSPPIALLMYTPPIVFTDEIVNFDASGSYDPDGFIVSYSWDFGDGITATGSTSSHSYSDDGEYLVILKIIDNDKIETFKAAIQVVKNRSPIAILNESKTFINKKEKTSFNASSSFDPDGEIISYKWNFEDGNTKMGKTVSHSFAKSGFYTIKLTVIDNDGATDSAYVTKFVGNNLPIASFTAIAQTPNSEMKISFEASESYDPDGIIVSYIWDFGDGNTATGKTTDHTYNKKGTYTITLTVTDDDYEKSTISETIKIDLNQSPVASFTRSTDTAYNGESIHFNGSSSYDSDGSIIRYEWDFGDGNTATGIEVEHVYVENGVFMTTLIVTDDDFATDSTTATKNVLNRPPVALLAKNASTIMMGEAIRFEASESYDPDGIIVSYIWDFGDGNTATGKTTDHTYNKKGTYTTILTVTDNDGHSVLTVVEIMVEQMISVSISSVSLSIVSVICLSLTTLTATLLYGLFMGRKSHAKDV